eukprot:c19047_g1_i6.p1 GENE.c19047_g1_i6~~c19047_g1_i6.p1  ORF type:complete len:589 (+),score=148.10 c19047_g1_i6:1117-2883(+)
MGNEIGDSGAVALSETLRRSITLEALHLGSMVSTCSTIVEGMERVLQNRLQTKARLSELCKEKVIPTYRFKLFFCGETGVGKTALARSYRERRGLFERMWSERQQADPTNPEERTAGILVELADLEIVGDVSIWDYSGSKEFDIAHEMFLGDSAAVFVLACSLSDEVEKRCAGLVHWLRLIRSRFEEHHPMSDVSEVLKPHVVLVGTNMDDPLIEDDVVEGSSGYHSVWGNEFLRLARSQFEDTLDLGSKFHVIDSRKSTSFEMDVLRASVMKCYQSILPLLPNPPLLGHYAKAAVQLLRQTRAWMSSEEFVKRVLSYCPPNIRAEATPDLIAKVIRYLCTSGEIAWLGNESDLAANVIIDVPWFCSEVIGPIFAPQTITSVQNLDLPPDATVHMSQVRSLFVEGREARGLRGLSVKTIDGVVQLFQNLELCFESRPEHLTFPSRLRLEKPDGIWSQGDWAYSGRRFQITDPRTDMFAVGYFPRVQCRCGRLFSNVKLWHNGVFASVESGAEFLIQLSPDEGVVDLIVRTQSAADINDKPLLDQLVEVLTSAQAQYSKSVELRVLELSVFEGHNCWSPLQLETNNPAD